MGPDQGARMGDLQLDDARGFWRDLAMPAFEEFWQAYQDDSRLDVKALLLVYRRLLCAALLLNHLADKVAPYHRLKSGKEFMDLIQEQNSSVGSYLHACRHLSNDAKHLMRGLQDAKTRQRRPDFDGPGDSEVFEIFGVFHDGTHADICLAVCEAWNFWVSYFDGSADVNFHQYLASRQIPTT